MELQEYSDAAAFLFCTAEFRARHPLLTNVISTVTEAVVAGRQFESACWWAVTDDDEVVGVAMRTAPYFLVLSPMPEQAARVLSARIREAFPQLPGVAAPKDVGAWFLDGHFSQTARSHVRMHQYLRVLGQFIPAPAVSGSPRPIRDTDLPLLLEWMRQFKIDAGVHGFDPDAAVRNLVERGYLWEVDGELVAVCGHTTVTGDAGSRVVRIGPVFTPKPHRGRGFAGATTSHVITLLQPRAETIMLYADAGNASSNGVYERLGMHVAVEMIEWELSYQ